MKPTARQPSPPAPRIPALALDEARALVSSPLLWPRVRVFLFGFASAIHLSRLPPLPASLSPSTSPRVARHVLDALGVAPFFHAFPDGEPAARLALLDPGEWLSLSRWLGALAAVPALRRTTRGPAVHTLREALPGVYPDVLSFAPYFDRFDLPALLPAGFPAEPSPDAISALGHALLLAAVPPSPAPLRQRLLLRLPDTFSPDPAPAPPPFPAVLRLLKLKFPDLHRLCST